MTHATCAVLLPLLACALIALVSLALRGYWREQLEASHDRGTAARIGAAVAPLLEARRIVLQIRAPAFLRRPPGMIQ